MLKFYHKYKISDTIYKNDISIDYKIANAKISKNDTIIFSITPALVCTSALNGHCSFYRNKKCYAIKNELQYNFSVLYKDRQKSQWQKMNAKKLANNFIKIKKLYPKIKFLRINESGDVTRQDVKKLNVIANILKKHNIKVYTYTHNIKIKNADITSENLIVNSSNKKIKLSNRFLSYSKAKNDRILKMRKNTSIKKCIGDCEICKLCTFATQQTLLCDIH